MSPMVPAGISAAGMPRLYRALPYKRHNKSHISGCRINSGQQVLAAVVVAGDDVVVGTRVVVVGDVNKAVE